MINDDSDEEDSTEQLNGYALQWNEGLRPEDVDEGADSSEDD